MRGLFVSGTDTGVGKSVLTGAILATLRARGEAVRPLKPVLSGLDDPPDADFPPDHVLLAAAAGRAPEETVLRSYGPPVSPHLAASLAGEAIGCDSLVAEILAAPAEGEILVVEGVGGLLVPLDPGWDVRRLAGAVGLPLVIAARPGLGTINHTLLTLEAARSAGLTVAGVVLTPWLAGAEPDAIERSNRETIETLGDVTVAVLPRVPSADPELLAAAGAELPLDDWLACPTPKHHRAGENSR